MLHVFVCADIDGLMTNESEFSQPLTQFREILNSYKWHQGLALTGNKNAVYNVSKNRNPR